MLCKSSTNSDLALRFSRGPCVPLHCQSPALPSPPPPLPVPVNGALRPETVSGGVKTELRALPGWDRPRRCPTSTRTTNKDSVSHTGTCLKMSFQLKPRSERYETVLPSITAVLSKMPSSHYFSTVHLSRGPSPISLSTQEAWPVAAAITEYINAYFKGGQHNRSA